MLAQAEAVEKIRLRKYAITQCIDLACLAGTSDSFQELG
jgi:hypothetical protein